MISLVLYQPDIPQNTGTMMRLCACLGLEVHVIEPTGFELTDRALRRAGMDYLVQVSVIRHLSWDKFVAWQTGAGRRLVLATTQAARPYTDFAFRADDLLLMGRESAGVPESVHRHADARLTIPMVAGVRSLNVATAAAMMLGEALRQTGEFPPTADVIGADKFKGD
jgi:tRNA (cytidine/uridine-2'-O-)-methyltransferase